MYVQCPCVRSCLVYLNFKKLLQKEYPPWNDHMSPLLWCFWVDDLNLFSKMGGMFSRSKRRVNFDSIEAPPLCKVRMKDVRRQQLEGTGFCGPVMCRCFLQNKTGIERLHEFLPIISIMMTLWWIIHSSKGEFTDRFMGVSFINEACWGSDLPRFAFMFRTKQISGP